MGEVRRTLIPQFSLRRILGITSALAVVAFVASEAGRGWAWAAGISSGLLAALLAFVVYGVLFAAAWLCGRVIRPRPSKAPPSSTNILTVLVTVGSIAIAHSAWGASGGSITLPMLGPKQVNHTGLELTLDTTWVDSFGYRPVRVEVRSIAGAVPADRVLTLRFRPHVGYTQQSNVTVIQTLEIPAGSSTARETLSVPQDGAWGSFELDVFEDRRYVEQLSIGANAGWASWSGTDLGDRSAPVILALADADRQSPLRIQIDSDSAEVLVVKEDRKPAAPSLSGSPGFAQKDFVHIEELPTRWIDYSGVDVVICSRARLQELTAQYPGQWKAIGAWLRNGGNLVVSGAGKNWEGMASLEQAVGWNAEDLKAAGDGADPTKRGWELPANEAAPTEAVAMADAPFVSRACGLGMVAAIRGESLPADTRFNWKRLFNTLGPQRWQWSQRYGLSLARANSDFWSFLIPGVGLAPVTLFQVFITLFMLAIGPVNYFVLKRWGKLNLMVVTVPAGALLVTIGLVGSALLAHGLGVRVRARSVTTIDQHRSEAACWARLSYYAGLAPGAGLTFSEETAVLPLEAEPDSAAERNSLRTVQWGRIHPSDTASPLEQRLVDGWLLARTPTQFITARIGKTKAKLEVEAAEAGRPRQIINRLGARIERLVLTDEQGDCFVGADVAPEATSALRPATSQHEACEPINAMLTANQPEPPQGISSNVDDRRFFGLGGGNRSRYPYRFRGSYSPQSGSSGASAAAQNTSVLERTIRETAEQLKNDKLPPRSYVAVVESAPEVELGTPAAREEASFHFVVGKW